MLTGENHAFRTIRIRMLLLYSNILSAFDSAHSMLTQCSLSAHYSAHTVLTGENHAFRTFRIRMLLPSLNSFNRASQNYRVFAVSNV